MSVTSVRLHKEIEVPLEQLAEKLDRSKNYLINLAIKEFVAKQAMESSRWSDTIQALESIQSGETIGESKVNEWLDTWGTSDESSAPTK